MEKTNIIVRDHGGDLRFKYPYMFYFFCGRYIANNLESEETQKLVVFMSERLYNYDYGNIMIFVCYFATNIQIISIVLERAQKLLNDFEPFNFKDYSEVFEEANKIIAHQLEDL
jgi:hypothetical protein